MRSRPLVIGLGVTVLVIAAGLGVLTFFGARDDSTLDPQEGPGIARPAGQQPVVRTGNVVLLYRDPADRAPLEALQDELSGPPDPALEAAGQAVLVRRSPALSTRVATLSASHRLDLPAPADPRVRSFAEFWLGRASG